MMVVCLMQAGLYGAVASADGGKEIPIIITMMWITHNGKEVEPGEEIEFLNHDSFKVNFAWAVDYTDGHISVEDGDYSHGIQLWPAGSLPISISYPLNGILKDDEGNIIGSFVLGAGGADGKLDFAFNDKLEGHFDVSGIITVETTINYLSSTVTENEVEFYGEEFTYSFIYARQETEGAEIAKSNISASAGAMAWRIDVNTRLIAEPQSNTVIDTLTEDEGFAGHLIVPGSIKVYPLTINLVTGAAAAGALMTEGCTAVVAGDGKSMEVTFDDLCRKAYRIEYDTEPDPDYMGPDDTYKNTAALGDASSDAQITPYIVPVTPDNSKSGSITAVTSTAPAYITWSILANSNGSALTSPLIITDTLGSGQKYRGLYSSSPVQRRYIDPVTGVAGSWTAVSTSGTAYYTLSDTSDSGFTVTVTNPGDYYEYRVRYYADITEQQTLYTNDAVINQGNDVTGSVSRGSTSVGNTHTISKTTTGYNPTSQTITWQVLYSARNTTQTVSTMSDTWTLPAGTTMTLQGGAVTLIERRAGSGSWTAIASGYSVATTASGFTVNFDSPYVVLAPFDQLRITFTTDYTLPSPDANGQINGGSALRFSNTATINSVSSTVNRDISDFPNLTYLNSAKSGSYNNGRFLWTITFNTLGFDMGAGPVAITDWWGSASSQQQEFIPGSFRVEVLDGSVWVDGTSLITSGPAVDDDGTYKDRRFTLLLEGIGTQGVRITYEAYRVGTPVSTYTNTARIGDGTAFSASVTGIPTTLLSKGAALGSGNTINWTVTVNEACFDLENVTVADVMGKGQILNADSVVVTRLTTGGSVAATLIKDSDYTVQTVVNPLTGTTTLTIAFSESYTFNASHRIAYTSIVDADTIERDLMSGMYAVDNHVRLSGDRITETLVTTKQANHWTIVSGTGSGAPAPVYLLKLDADTGAPLEGAEFILTDESGEYEFRTGMVTDSDGMIYVADLTAGAYRLIEVKAPDGYILPDPAYQVFNVTLTDVDGLTLTFVNQKESPPANPTEEESPPPTKPTGEEDPLPTKPTGEEDPPPTKPTGEKDPPPERTQVGGDDDDYTSPPIVQQSVEQPYTPGGRDIDEPPVPMGQGNTLMPDGDGWLELDDDGVPLGRWSWDDELEEWIFDMFPPLGDFPSLPQTGARGVFGMWVCLIAAALLFLGLALLNMDVLRKKAQEAAVRRKTGSIRWITRK